MECSSIVINNIVVLNYFKCSFKKFRWFTIFKNFAFNLLSINIIDTYGELAADFDSQLLGGLPDTCASAAVRQPSPVSTQRTTAQCAYQTISSCAYSVTPLFFLDQRLSHSVTTDSGIIYIFTIARRISSRILFSSWFVWPS